MYEDIRHDVREFFGFCMRILRQRGLGREEAKALIRGSGLVERSRTYDGAQYVLHFDVYEWCDYLMNGYVWPDNSQPNDFDRYYA